MPRPRVPSSTGLPADLIRNRPDIRTAERQFAAATAAIGVSEAQLYPSVSIGGSLAGGDTGRWSFGPSLNIPLLTRGVIKANIEVAESQARQAELQYRQTVLRAVEEVQSAITLCMGWHRQLNSQEAAQRAAASVLRLSRESYRGGAITLTEVLDAERQLSQSRLATIDALRNYTASWVQMHISTGQGWRSESLLKPIEYQPAEIPVDPLGVKDVELPKTGGGEAAPAGETQNPFAGLRNLFRTKPEADAPLNGPQRGPNNPDVALN